MVLVPAWRHQATTSNGVDLSEVRFCSIRWDINKHSADYKVNIFNVSLAVDDFVFDD